MLGKHISDSRLVASANTNMRNQGARKILCWGELFEIEYLWVWMKPRGCGGERHALIWTYRVMEP